MSIPGCRVCGSEDLFRVLDLGEQALTGVFPYPGEEVGTGPLRLDWCRECTLVQLADSQPPAEMYGDNYGYRSGLNRSMVNHLMQKARWLERFAHLQPRDTVLDIGSNDGTLLGFYSPSVRRIGIDPTAEKFREYYPNGVDFVSDFFTLDNFFGMSGKRARIITSIAMFYDLEDPVNFARDVRFCLADDGIWHFEQSYMPTMLRNTAYDMVCHEHLEYYSLEVIDRILREAGFQIVNVRFNDVNGGSVAVTATHRRAAVHNDRVFVDWYLGQEREKGFDTLEPFRKFQVDVWKHRQDLRATVRGLRECGASVMGLGASTKGNTLLQFCDFDALDIEAIGEVNPDKCGKITPGTHIPIICEDEMRDRRPDYLLVLPWHFRDNIIRREERYLKDGGRLIFPLPNIEIVGA